MKSLISAVLLVSAAYGDVVTDWNAVMLATVRPQGAHIQSRIAAVTHIAMHDAVNSITNEYRTYGGRIAAPATASMEAAAIASAHRVLVTYVPASAAALDAERTRALGAIPDGPAKTAGMQVGEAAAQAVLAMRSNDGSATQVPYTPNPAVGYWQPTPPAMAAPAAVNWGGVVPFAMKSGDQFRPEPPPALTSRAYTRDYAEVKAMGAVEAPGRSQQQSWLAQYMAMTSPTQIWNPVLAQLSAAEGMAVAEKARAFALMNMAIADAAIAVFDAKYHYNFWRPLTAIRGGELDENAKTESDAGFTSFIAAPPYPSYPSGYAAFSNAARGVLEALLGRGPQRFTIPAIAALPELNLEYTRVRQLTDDIDDARICGGIHFRFDQDAASDMGERIGRLVVKKQLRPVSGKGE